MTLVNTKSYNRYKQIKTVLAWCIPIIAILLSISFLIIVYEGLEDKKDLSSLCYALFAANALIANTLFNLGRSAVFLKKNNEQQENKIYSAGLTFLYGALLAAFLSGWTYAVTDTGFMKGNHFLSPELTRTILLVSLTLGFTLTLIFSIVGLVKFVQWHRSRIVMVETSAPSSSER